VQRDNDSTEAIYGSKVASEDVLSGKVSVPESAQAFLAAVKGAKALAKSE
jgi:lipid-binding SYLF domain-containing protein